MRREPWRVRGWTGAALRTLLWPAELAFRGGQALYHAFWSSGLARRRRLPVPVISVGNIVVGGAGKTPVVRWLAERLVERGERPGIVHVGWAPDEPELHRRWHPELPVAQGKDRLRAGRAALAAGATALLLDDAFQHRRLARDLDIVLVPAESWSRRPRLLPAGPWREPPSALSRADVVVVTRRTATEERAAAVAAEAAVFGRGAAVVRLALQPAGWLDARLAPAAPPRGPCLVVTGVAAPEAVAAQATEAGADVVGLMPFPDHHEYGRRDADAIRRRAAGAAVVTTAKDAVKLAPLLTGDDLRVLAQRVVVEAGAELLEARLREALT